MDPAMGSELMYNPLGLKKAKTARDAFLQGLFIITIYLIIIDNWICNATCENYLQLHQERCSILS